ncbi:hypothetical protein Dda_0154 [Drechslerella dactyloides]|uniref:Uncharacterized protein n=1 Tax=Drechslerella dactyloides TaxID=74499 RepID=A0AAD6J651_DREDA|nr:hypothetical protein Dda_0154 [Drechslerella dactyloides]
MSSGILPRRNRKPHDSDLADDPSSSATEENYPHSTPSSTPEMITFSQSIVYITHTSYRTAGIITVTRISTAKRPKSVADRFGTAGENSEEGATHTITKSRVVTEPPVTVTERPQVTVHITERSSTKTDWDALETLKVKRTIWYITGTNPDAIDYGPFSSVSMIKTIVPRTTVYFTNITSVVLKSGREGDSRKRSAEPTLVNSSASDPTALQVQTITGISASLYASTYTPSTVTLADKTEWALPSPEPTVREPACLTTLAPQSCNTGGSAAVISIVLYCLIFFALGAIFGLIAPDMKGMIKEWWCKLMRRKRVGQHS